MNILIRNYLLIGTIWLSMGESCIASTRPAAGLDDAKARASYTIGVQLGTSLRRRALDLDAEATARGLKDALAGSTPQISKADAGKALADFAKKHQVQRQGHLKQVGTRNAAAGETYRAANSRKAGVVVLSSGLQYRVLKEGTGRIPAATDTVITRYQAKFLDGVVFDGSSRYGGQNSFQLAKVIPGWREALLKMKAGSKWELVVPPALAYGEKGRGREIGPNATLIFELELVDIQ
jgi:FKBP-type peptidyl-prolyl cis-trans isomerase FklB